MFDSRGIGNTTAGSEPYSMQLLANDTAGLMDALKIQKANVLWIFPRRTTQLNNLQLRILIRLVGLYLLLESCGGKDGIPKPPEFKKLQSEIVNKSLNNVPISQEEMKSLVSASLGSGWSDCILNLLRFQKSLHYNK